MLHNVNLNIVNLNTLTLCLSICNRMVKALVWFWLIDKTLSANLVYQSNCEIGSTTPSDEAMTKIRTMVMAW